MIEYKYSLKHSLRDEEIDETFSSLKLALWRYNNIINDVYKVVEEIKLTKITTVNNQPFMTQVIISMTKRRY